jgi:hypothetical protein
LIYQRFPAVSQYKNQYKIPAWIIKNQLGRRNLSDYDRGILGNDLIPALAEEAKERQLSTLKQNSSKTDDNADSTVRQNSAERTQKNKRPREIAAELVGVSHDTLTKTKNIRDKGIPELKQAASIMPSVVTGTTTRYFAP